MTVADEPQVRAKTALAHPCANVLTAETRERLLAPIARGELEVEVGGALAIRLTQIEAQIAAAAGANNMTADVEQRTEGGNARRLVRKHGSRIRFVHPWGKWLVYDGTRFAKDETAEVAQLAKDVVRDLYVEAAGGATAEERAALGKWAAQSDRAVHIRAMLELAASEDGIPVTPAQLDADPYLLNCRNGTLDLRTSTLRPHDPADLISKLAPVAYVPDGACPRFLRFLDELFPERPDVIAYLQRAIGYALTGETSEQVLFLLLGPSAGGKSTLLQLLHALLGDYAAQAPFSTFLEQRGEGGGNDLARLAGARLVAASEAGEGVRLDEGLVKSVTGGDTVVARFLYREYFQFRPAFKLFLVANHKPTIRGTDEAIWRRIHHVPLTVSIPEPDRDPKLLEKLTAELPGILRWAIEGCRAWQREGLQPPDAVRSATRAYREEMDVVGLFLDECCRLTRTGRSSAGALYTAYTSWTEHAGEHAMSQRRFGARLAERGLAQVKSNGRMHWLGIELVPDATGMKGPSDPSGGKSLRARVGERFPRDPTKVLCSLRPPGSPGGGRMTRSSGAALAPLACTVAPRPALARSVITNCWGRPVAQDARGRG